MDQLPERISRLQREAKKHRVEMKKVTGPFMLEIF